MDTDAVNQICSMVRMHARSMDAVVCASVAEPVDAECCPEAAALLESTVLHSAAAAVALEQRLDELQETFLRELQARLEAAGLSLEERLEISLSEGGLLLEGSAAGSGALLEAMKSSPLLEPLFHRLHRLALMLRGLELLRAGGRDVDVPLTESGIPEYRICLKGPLSHFYLR